MKITPGGVASAPWERFRAPGRVVPPVGMRRRPGGALA